MKTDRLILRSAFACLLAGCAAGFPAHATSQPYERRLIAIAEDIAHGRVDGALIAARRLVEQHPASRVAQLMYADLLSARTSGLSAIGSGAFEAHPQSIQELRHELDVRWIRMNDEATSRIELLPDSLIQAAPSTRQVLFADLSQSRLYLYRNDRGTLKLLQDFYMSQGLNGAGKQREGDQRTPIGVYHLTGYIPGSTLPSRYGPGALPINYPNPMDRHRERTGYGIWIHGTEPYLVNRAPRASDGCLALNNDDFHALQHSIAEPEYTPIVIDASPTWLSRQQVASRRENILVTIDNWRKDRESRDPDDFLSHYDPERFSNGMIGFEEWSEKKRIEMASTGKVSITIQDVEIFAYPGEDNVVMVDLEQSDTIGDTIRVYRKHFYWQRQGGRWRVIFETPGEKAATTIIVDESEDAHDRGQEPASS